jgi:hypothetical protein
MVAFGFNWVWGGFETISPLLVHRCNINCSTTIMTKFLPIIFLGGFLHLWVSSLPHPNEFGKVLLLYMNHSALLQQFWTYFNGLALLISPFFIHSNYMLKIQWIGSMWIIFKYKQWYSMCEHAWLSECELPDYLIIQAGSIRHAHT